MSKFSKRFFLIPMILTFIFYQPISAQGIPDTPFVQEYHVPYPVSENIGANDVRAIAVDKQDNVWVATKAGVYMLENGEKQWTAMMSQDEAGPAFDVTVDPRGDVWIGCWNGIYRFGESGWQKIESISQPVAALYADGNQVIGLGPDGMWRFRQGKWEHEAIPISKNIRSIISDKKGGYWISTGMGLYHQVGDEFTLYQSEKELLSADVYGVAYAGDGKLWIGGLGGITLYQHLSRAGQFTPEEGLPSIDVNSVICGPEGTMWVSTKIGVARYDGKKWSLLHSKRWLLDDEVRDVSFDSQGNAWIATARGVSAIKRKMMTLSRKADYFQRICMKRHVRPPYIVEKCRLLAPGDTSKWEPRDDDNDGQYTSMYLAMESFRYAVTKSIEAKQNAKKAFEALRFLQTVTETPGFVARTVIPSDWTKMADANRIHTPREKADIRVREPRYKPVDKRWRLSRDGKWLWKGDTSSDEITGHMFGYLFYYDLVADKKEKKRVAEHVCNIVDYIIEGGYVLKDIDGTHTRWGVWSPEKLNDDPDWRAERGINAVEILSYLKLAYHVSGKKRYQQEYLKLIHKYHYADHARTAKTFHPSWITHIDDELLALAFPALLLYEDDPALKKVYRESLDRWYDGIKADESPYFDFTYAMLSDVKPDLDRVRNWLYDVPLDLVRWRVDNTKRLDVHIVRYPELESLQTNRLLPPSERSLFRWDNNPWRAIQGDGGYTESDGVFWLLPYWMGRYLGYLRY